MANLFNQDFQDFLRAFHSQQVRYVLVGGYSVILHGYSRTTGDLDLWVEKSAENYSRLEKAFQEFGMPIFYTMLLLMYLRLAGLPLLLTLLLTSKV